MAIPNDTGKEQSNRANQHVVNIVGYGEPNYAGKEQGSRAH
jgi:hypothetical protein